MCNACVILLEALNPCLSFLHTLLIISSFLRSAQTHTKIYHKFMLVVFSIQFYFLLFHFVQNTNSCSCTTLYVCVCVCKAHMHTNYCCGTSVFLLVNICMHMCFLWKLIMSPLFGNISKHEDAPGASSFVFLA